MRESCADAMASAGVLLGVVIAPNVVIAGLDPAIHAAERRSLADLATHGASVWTTGSSPVVTEKRRSGGDGEG
jgi:hypothetical protein